MKPASLPEFAFIETLLDRLAAHERITTEQPFVTLSYAQSLDGSIAIKPYCSCVLSSEASLKLTHFLRASHAALLVGVNTIIADDPQLTVRRCNGSNPQAVILDSALRFPLDAHVLKAASKPPLIVTTQAAATQKIAALTACGAKVIIAPANAQGMVDLAATLRLLYQHGLHSIMVEGGGAVINRFLQEALVDYCVITVTPKIIGGFKAVAELCQPPEQALLTIADCQYQLLGSDMIVHGPLCAN